MNTIYIHTLTAAWFLALTIVVFAAHLWVFVIAWLLVRRIIHPLRCFIIWLDDQETARIALARRRALESVKDAWRDEEEARNAMLTANKKDQVEARHRSLRQATVIRERRERQLLNEINRQTKGEN